MFSMKPSISCTVQSPVLIEYDVMMLLDAGKTILDFSAETTLETSDRSFNT